MAPLTLLLVVGAGLSAGCRRSPSETGQSASAVAQNDDGPRLGLNVLLISIDTVRPDHLGCYGHPNIRTPHTDRLAAEGVLFLECTSSCPITLPSHCSMMTATHPLVHGARDNGRYHLHSDNLTLAELLKQAGYVTAAEVAAFVMNREFGLDQGFDAYGDTYADRLHAVGGQRAAGERRATEICDSVLRWLRAHADKRFFLFVHFFDPHFPYEPPEKFRRQYTDPYVAEIAYVDDEIGRLLAALDELGLEKKTLLILTSDHGEGRGEHGESTHATFIYDSTLSVPLIFRCPGLIPAGQRVGAQVRLVDIAPTILDLLGLEPLPDAQGVSLQPLITGRRDDLHLAAYSESLYAPYAIGCSHLRSLRAAGWKLIHAPQPELYHVSVDPHERHNLARAQPERVAEMRATLRRFVAQSPAVIGAGEAQRLMTQESVRVLQSLGYVGGGSAETLTDAGMSELDRFEPRGPDPKDHVELVELVGRTLDLAHTQHPDAEKALRECIGRAPDPKAGFAWAYVALADVLARKQQHDEAVEWYRRALRVAPNDSRVLSSLGEGLVQIGKLEEAIAAYRASLKVKPAFARTHCALADALAMQGKTDEAIAHFRRALEMNPRLTQAHRNLGVLYAQSGRMDEAVAAYQQALQRAPQELQIRRELARLLAAQGDRAALDHYRKTIDANPEEAASHVGLGEVYLLLGEPGPAEPNFRRALELDAEYLVAYDRLAGLLQQQGRDAEAVEVLRRGLVSSPENPRLANNLAWLLATAPDATLRDGAEALRLARLACRATDNQNVNYLDTLAAACAEVGRFKDAVETIDQAIELATRRGQTDQVAQMKSLRRLYEQRMPYRTEP